MGRKSIAKVLNPHATRKEVTQFNNIMKSLEACEKYVKKCEEMKQEEREKEKTKEEEDEREEFLLVEVDQDGLYTLSVVEKK